MRRIATGLLVFAAATQTAGAVAGPTIRVVRANPLVVRGAHFKAAERVTVQGPSVTRVVRTTAFGTFRVVLGTAPADRCSMRKIGRASCRERV